MGLTSVLIFVCVWVAIAVLLTALWIVYVEVHLAKLNRGARRRRRPAGRPEIARQPIVGPPSSSSSE